MPAPASGTAGAYAEVAGSQAFQANQYDDIDTIGARRPDGAGEYSEVPVFAGPRAPSTGSGQYDDVSEAGGRSAASGQYDDVSEAGGRSAASGQYDDVSEAGGRSAAAGQYDDVSEAGGQRPRGVPPPDRSIASGLYDDVSIYNGTEAPSTGSHQYAEVGEVGGSPEARAVPNVYGEPNAYGEPRVYGVVPGAPGSARGITAEDALSAASDHVYGEASTRKVVYESVRLPGRLDSISSQDVDAAFKGRKQ